MTLSIKLNFLCISLLFISTLSQGQESWCGNSGDNSSWVEFSPKKCYKLIPERMTWQQGSDRCLSLPQKSRLATIQSPEEQSFVSNLLFNRSGLTSTAWLGGYRLQDKFQWVSDGEPLTYTNWAPGRPLEKRGGQCLVIDQGSKWSGEELGKWRDVYCDAQNYWVLCEQTRSIDFGKWKQIFEQFQRDLDTTKFNLDQAKIYMEEDRIGLLQAKDEVQKVREEMRQVRGEFVKSVEEINKTRDEFIRMMSVTRDLKEDVQKVKEWVNTTNDKVSLVVEILKEFRKDSTQTRDDLNKMQEWAANSTASKAVLYNDQYREGTAEPYNLNPTVYISGCRSLQRIGGNVKSIDTRGTCVRVYENYGCGGSRKSLYSGDGNDHNQLYVGFRIRSVGPCYPKTIGSREGVWIAYE